MKKAWFVYILTCADGTYYTGITTDLNRRVSEHNSNKSDTKYTRARQPVCVSYFEVQASRAEASQREFAIKQLTREEKHQLVCTPRQSVI